MGRQEIAATSSLMAGDIPILRYAEIIKQFQNFIILQLKAWKG